LTASVRTCAAISMRSPKKRSGPSRTPRDKRAQIQKIAKEYGIEPPKVGQDLDEKYSAGSAQSSSESSTVYQKLAGAFSVEALEVAEKVVYVVLSIMLVLFIGSGLGISSEAFFKASGKEVPENIDMFLTNLEQLFTPTIVIFLALSSMLGLFKQSQLSSGATTYTEVDKDNERK